ncbi:MAG: RnfABCDGE type electron transport complex subunit D [Paludibacteraceae bacterium]|nr:RnfABCDGE type electron transport complex subunit D [Paludibacteraceae bacterium]
MNNLVVSPAPHIHSGNSVPKEMKGVLIALIPAYLAALYYFGLGAFIVSITAVISCVAFEYLIQRFLLKGELTINNLSAVVTGLLLSFNLPSNLPIWIIIIGSLAAIGIGKMSFGGLGNNPFNPALIGRVFLLISFPVQMTTWPKPIPFNIAYLDAETSATALTLLKEHTGTLPSTLDMFLGNMGGSLGEVSALALLIGFVYLLVKKIISWHIPISILATVAIFAGILHFIHPEMCASPLTHLLTGGLLLGAIYMATDYVTSPMSKLGMIIYGIGIGLITVIIRVWGSYPEGMSFAILIMNGFTPLINAYVKPKRFAEVVKQ